MLSRVATNHHPMNSNVTDSEWLYRMGDTTLFYRAALELMALS